MRTIRRNHRFSRGCLLVSVGLCACTHKPAEPELPGDTLACVGDGVITYAALKTEATRRQQQGLQALGERELFAQRLKQDVYLARAKTIDVAADPEVRAQLNRILVQAVRARELQPKIEQVAITESDLRSAYTAQIDRFTTPGYQRLSAIKVSIPPHVSEMKTQELLARVEQVQAAVDAWCHAPDYDAKKGFGTVALDFSELVRGRYRGGDLGWVQASGRSPFLPAEVYDAGVALPIGVASPMISTELGYFWVMRTDERTAQIKPFEQIRQSLTAQLRQQAQAEVEAAYFQSAFEGSEGMIFTNRVNALRSDTGSVVSRDAERALPTAFSGTLK